MQKSPTTLVGSGRKPLGSTVVQQAKNSPEKGIFTLIVPSCLFAEKPRTQALDDFVVKHLLGKGAFGEVYLAYHKRTERYMAMKQMDKSLIRMQGKVRLLFGGSCAIFSVFIYLLFIYLSLDSTYHERKRNFMLYKKPLSCQNALLLSN
jgi:serine/threonine protein kinase